METKKIMTGMSGGVDSSVAAYLLIKEGFEVFGVTMKLFDSEDVSLTEKSCCTSDDAEDARAVCSLLGIKHYMFNLTEDFKKNVIGRFAEAYANGLTPNPCIDCNRYLKFRSLMSRAEELGMDYLATGHYARIEKQGDTFYLKKARDSSKDQSYVLYCLTQEQLKKVKFPLGNFTKAEVREIAAQNGFVNAKKHESQDICFVPDGDYGSFIERYTGRKFPCGDFTDMNGNRLGEHKGIIRYTVGQRRGLGLALPESMYVVKKDVANNRVVLGFDRDLYSSEVNVGDVTFTCTDALDGEQRLSAKIRYNQKEQPACVIQTDETHIKIVFDEPQRAVTKGQSAVLYDGDTVVGGGIIE